MRKRIPVSDLRVGMFIEELCGSWMEHPFWRSSFRLADPADRHRIVDAGITEVWIDTAKGLDVIGGGGERVNEATARIEIEQALRSAAETPARDTQRTSLAAEARRAASICATAKTAVTSMFQEARMGKALDAEAAEPLVAEISHSIMRNPGALISLARLKTLDDYTYMHSVAVCALMIALARELGLADGEVREAGMAGLLHDIGKMMIPLEVLNKPGKLTDEEFRIVRAHPAEGHKLLVAGRAVSAVSLDVCLHHHEKVDGSGYPHRLKADSITLFSKMGAICDVYDAITSDRPYKRGWDPAEALRKMAEWSKGHFDERLFHAFVKCIGIYPIGSLVRLSSGRLGVVVEQTESLLAPRVKVFFSTRANSRVMPELLDLSRPGSNERVEAHEDPARWNFPDLAALWQPAASPA
jgi:putative nucleotidyltransferase with HDIG domain